MKKCYYYISTFIISLFSLLFFSFNSYASNHADVNRTFLFSGSTYNSTQYHTMSFKFIDIDDLYSLDISGSSNAYVSGTTQSLDGNYQVFHVVCELSPILFNGSEFNSYDSYFLDFSDEYRSINFDYSNPAYISVSNVSKYLLINLSGHEYKTDLQFSKVSHDHLNLSNIIATPVVEFDVILNLHSLSSTSLKTTIVDLIMSYSANSSSIYSVYGVNYISTGDNAIISAINDLLNGYSGTGVGDSSDVFDQGAAELESIESDLADTSNSNIINYVDTFDTSIIGSLGSSLVYVVTWFSNFWNLGGLFTSLLSVSMAIYVAFFIIFRRG